MAGPAPLRRRLALVIGVALLVAGRLCLAFAMVAAPSATGVHPGVGTLTRGVSLPAGVYPLLPDVIQLQSLRGEYVLSGGPTAVTAQLTYHATLVFTAAADASTPALVPTELVAADGEAVLTELAVALNGVPVVLEPAADADALSLVLPGGCVAGHWMGFNLGLAAGEQAEIQLGYNVRTRADGKAAIRAHLSGMSRWAGAVESAEVRYSAPGFDPWHFDYLYPAAGFRYLSQDQLCWQRAAFEPAGDVLVSLDAASWRDEYLSGAAPTEVQAKHDLRNSFAQADAHAGDRLALWPIYERVRQSLLAADPPGSAAALARYVLAKLTPGDIPPQEEPLWQAVTVARGPGSAWRFHAVARDPDADLVKWELAVFTGGGAGRQELLTCSGLVGELELCGELVLDEVVDLPWRDGMRLELTALDSAGHRVKAEPVELTRDPLASPAFWWIATGAVSCLAFWLRRRVKRTVARGGLHGNRQGWR